jgi:hypothetical protein
MHPEGEEVSTCISRHGEWSDHLPDQEFTCTRCGALDEEGVRGEVERLTRECLDREATETDARERLRRCEERLAAVEALHVRTPTDAGPDYCPECSEAAQEWVRWPCPTAAAVKSDQ